MRIYCPQCGYDGKAHDPWETMTERDACPACAATDILVTDEDAAPEHVEDAPPWT